MIPLALAHQHSTGPSAPLCDYDDELSTESLPGGFGQRLSAEFGQVMSLSLPIGLSMFLFFAERLAQIAAVWRIGTMEGAAFANVCAFTEILDKIAMANIGRMTMLVIAAFGHENHVLVGIWLQIFFICATVCWVLLFVPRFLALTIFEQLGASSDVISNMQTYLWYSAPGSLFQVWYLHLEEWHKACGHVKEDLVTNIIAVAVAIPVWTFFKKDWGFAVYGLCVSAMWGLRFVVYLVVLWAGGSCKDLWHGIQWREIRSRHRWQMVASTFLPQLFAALSDDFLSRVLNLYVCGLGPIQANASLLVFQLHLSLIVIGIPLSSAIGVRVGLQMTKSNSRAACFTCFFGLALYCGVLNSAGAVLAHYLPSLVPMLTPDPKVVQKVMEVRWCFLLMGAGMVLFPAIEILLKQGRLKLIYRASLAAIVQTPLGCFLFDWFGFLRMSAVIYGTFLVTAINSAVLVVCVFLTDWKAARRNSLRLSETGDDVAEDVAAEAAKVCQDSPLSSDTSESIASAAAEKDRAGSLLASLSLDPAPTKVFSEGVSGTGGPMPLLSESPLQIGAVTGGSDRIYELSESELPEYELSI